MAEFKRKRNFSNNAEKKSAPVSESWAPKSELGRKVKSGEIKDIDEILNSGQRILESEITDTLLPSLESDLVMLGQSRGKFGGGQRRAFKQTQKKTDEGNSPSFATCAIIGNRNGYFGIGFGKAKETIPSREKAMRNARLNITKVRRGCGAWKCGCGTPHSIPFTVKGKCGSVIVELIPAPKGVGLCAEKECRKILALAGIKDIWSYASGQPANKTNTVRALVDALKNLMEMKASDTYIKELGIIEGKITKKEE
jgi:small subunit ribosomal protein S5